ncbi:KilA-N domain-containing protein [Pontibacter korlensis]|uniref:KilA-N domain-containing protein n=1 Tax=Pontibacter korlensis TaxID=400092 RepID=UPI00069757AC|nr:KilA-N domain-containing protein [Pontibacter korlensis]
MEKTKIFQYGSSFITFRLDDELMVNATEMAKPFPKKRVHDFIRSKQTATYINELQSESGIPVLVVNRGGSNSGTWMHKLLALKFAAWLSPKFEVWVYKRIEEIIINNFYSTSRDLSNLSPALTKKKLTYNVTTIGKMLSPSLSGEKLNQFLKEQGVQHKTDQGVWQLTDKYQNMGLAELASVVRPNRNGEEIVVNFHLKWTEKGRKFILDLYTKANSKTTLRSLPIPEQEAGACTMVA